VKCAEDYLTKIVISNGSQSGHIPFPGVMDGSGELTAAHQKLTSGEHSEGRADPVQQQRHRAFHRRVLGVLRHDLSQGPVQELFLPGRLHEPDQSGSV